MEHLWAELDEDRCPCKGGGWAEIDIDQFKHCPIHYIGQLHPQTRSLLLDEPARLAEEERRSVLKFRIEEVNDEITELQKKLKSAQAQLVSLQLELINKTPTLRMPAVLEAKEPEPMIEELPFEEFTLEF